jgi:hypothetical protein
VFAARSVGTTVRAAGAQFFLCATKRCGGFAARGAEFVVQEVLVFAGIFRSTEWVDQANAARCARVVHAFYL